MSGRCGGIVETTKYCTRRLTKTRCIAPSRCSWVAGSMANDHGIPYSTSTSTPPPPKSLLLPLWLLCAAHSDPYPRGPRIQYPDRSFAPPLPPLPRHARSFSPPRPRSPVPPALPRRHCPAFHFRPTTAPDIIIIFLQILSKTWGAIFDR